MRTRTLRYLAVPLTIGAALVASAGATAVTPSEAGDDALTGRAGDAAFGGPGRDRCVAEIRRAC